MYAPERQTLILARTRKDGRVDVATIADELDVTPETIRRDLTVLERHGSIRRVHGGAIPVERLSEELRVEERLQRNATEKLAIAQTALTLIPETGTLLIDAGTTTASFAAALPVGSVYTVVTHSLSVAHALAGRPGITLHLLGGTVRERTLAAVGATTLDQISKVTVDYSIVGINGITPEFGLSTPDSEEAAVKTAIIRSARQVIVLADHTKFGINDFAHVASLDDVDTIVTDDGVDRELLSRIESEGPEVKVA